tara:strand:+ start:2717 stop:3727 length:1011 start_codon:yes stop_codon:yes gene_type:complete
MTRTEHNHREQQRSDHSPDGGSSRSAKSPTKIGLRAWGQIALRVWKANGTDNLSVNAAGVAFYNMLAIFPAFTAFVMLYGLIADAADVQVYFVSMRNLIPNDAWILLNDQLTELAAQNNSSLGWGLVFSLTLAIWSSGAGIRALMSTLNVVYGEREKRSVAVFLGTAICLTLGGLFVALLSLLFIVGTPLALQFFLLKESVEIVLDVIVWVVLAGMMMIGLAVLFRFGPSRRDAKLRWLSVGSVAATLVWVLASIGFSFFVRNFGNYQETYGAAGAVIVLLMWFWVTAYIVLIGAELNAQMELQTRHDTTEGPSRPMGERGAYVADNVAPDPKADT